MQAAILQNLLTQILHDEAAGMNPCGFPETFLCVPGANIDAAARLLAIAKARIIPFIDDGPPAETVTAIPVGEIGARL